MSIFNDITDLREHFLSVWPDEVQVIFENEILEEEPKTTWARFSVVPGSMRQLAMFPLTYEARGRIYLQVFMPRGTNIIEGRRLEMLVVNAFRDWASDDYHLRVDPPELSIDEEPKWFVLRCSFMYKSRH